MTSATSGHGYSGTQRPPALTWGFLPFLGRHPVAGQLSVLTSESLDPSIPWVQNPTEPADPLTEEVLPSPIPRQAFYLRIMAFMWCLLFHTRAPHLNPQSWAEFQAQTKLPQSLLDTCSTAWVTQPEITLCQGLQRSVLLRKDIFWFFESTDWWNIPTFPWLQRVYSQMHSLSIERMGSQIWADFNVFSKNNG